MYRHAVRTAERWKQVTYHEGHIVPPGYTDVSILCDGAIIADIPVDNVTALVAGGENPFPRAFGGENPLPRGRTMSPPMHETCRLIKYEHAEVVGGFVTNTYFLIVHGIAECSNMTVKLEPLMYVKQPKYWEIRVLGCLPGNYCLPAMNPFCEELSLDSIRGTEGIEVVGDGQSEKIKIP